MPHSSPTLALLSGMIDRDTIIPTLSLLEDWMVTEDSERDALVSEVLDPFRVGQYPMNASTYYSAYLDYVHWDTEEQFLAAGYFKNPHLTLYVAMCILGLKRPTASGVPDSGIAYHRVFAILSRVLGQLGPAFIVACDQELRTWFQGHNADLMAMSSLATSCAYLHTAALAVQDAKADFDAGYARELKQNFTEAIALWNACLESASSDAQMLQSQFRTMCDEVSK